MLLRVTIEIAVNSQESLKVGMLTKSSRQKVEDMTKILHWSRSFPKILLEIDIGMRSLN